MNSLSGSEFKVLMAISRKTLGYQKTSDPISITQFEELTGLSNRSVINSIRTLEAKNIISALRRERKTTIFRINENIIAGEKNSQAKSVAMKKTHKSYEKSSQVDYENSSHTKESEKENQRKENLNQENQEYYLQAQKASKHLHEKISEKKNYKVPEPDWVLWNKSFSDLFEEYECSLELLKEVIDWSQQNSFWHSKTLTPKGIKKHFMTIESQMSDDEDNIKLNSAVPGVRQA